MASREARLQGMLSKLDTTPETNRANSVLQNLQNSVDRILEILTDKVRTLETENQRLREEVSLLSRQMKVAIPAPVSVPTTTTPVPTSNPGVTNPAIVTGFPDDLLAGWSGNPSSSN